MKLKQLLINLVAALALSLVPASVVVGTAAACGNTPAAQDVLSSVNDAGPDCGTTRVNNLFANIVNIMSIVVGVAAILVIMYAGFKYITSGGESGRVANAKSTLLYALVGVAVAALAQLMVHFVLSRS